MVDQEGDPVKVVEVWHGVFKDSTDHDLWGQPVEAIEGYQRYVHIFILRMCIPE